MAKKIYNNWLKGYTPYSENMGAEGTYAEARDIDPHRTPGFVLPGWKQSAKVSSASGVLSDLIVDVTVCPTNTGDFSQNNYYATDADHIYEITSTGTTFTDDANWPHDMPAGEDGESIVFCQIGGTWYLLCFTTTDIIRVANDTTFVDDYLTNASHLNDNALTDAPHPVLEWKSYLWIGNGNNVSKLDGPNEAWTEAALDLPVGWEITSLFPTRNYIGICAWRGQGSSNDRTESRVFFWDGSASDFNYQLPIEDNKIVSSYSDGGKVYLFTEGRGFGTSMRMLTETGDEIVKQMKISTGVGSSSSFTIDYHNAVGIFQNRILMGATGNTQNRIFAYGRPTADFPIAFTQPYSCSDEPSSTGGIGVVRQLFLNYIFVSAYDDTNYYWLTFKDGKSTNAFLKERYEELGQKARINYVKFYFRPLVSGDDVTPTLEVDYGTSVTLTDGNGNTNISYANDGAITSKRFDVKEDCHSFRPCLSWTAGGTAFSKIVVDYDFVNDI